MHALLGFMFLMAVLFLINVVILIWVLRINCIVGRLDTIANTLKAIKGDIK